jgi:hypothetical protein
MVKIKQPMGDKLRKSKKNNPNLNIENRLLVQAVK